jgi:hypothetical protein
LNIDLTPARYINPALLPGGDATSSVTFWVAVSSATSACVHGNATVTLAFFTPPTTGEADRNAFCESYMSVCGPTPGWQSASQCLDWANAVPNGSPDEYGGTLGCAQ